MCEKYVKMATQRPRKLSISLGRCTFYSFAASPNKCENKKQKNEPRMTPDFPKIGAGASQKLCQPPHHFLSHFWFASAYLCGLAQRGHSESHCNYSRLEPYLPSLGRWRCSHSTRRLLGGGCFGVRRWHAVGVFDIIKIQHTYRGIWTSWKLLRFKNPLVDNIEI